MEQRIFNIRLMYIILNDFLTPKNMYIVLRIILFKTLIHYVTFKRVTKHVNS